MRIKGLVATDEKFNSKYFYPAELLEDLASKSRTVPIYQDIDPVRQVGIGRRQVGYIDKMTINNVDDVTCLMFEGETESILPGCVLSLHGSGSMMATGAILELALDGFFWIYSNDARFSMAVVEPA